MAFRCRRIADTSLRFMLTIMACAARSEKPRTRVEVTAGCTQPWRFTESQTGNTKPVCAMMAIPEEQARCRAEGRSISPRIDGLHDSKSFRVLCLDVFVMRITRRMDQGHGVHIGYARWAVGPPRVTAPRPLIGDSSVGSRVSPAVEAFGVAILVDSSLTGALGIM